MAKIGSQISQLAGPLERLRISGRDFLEGTNDEQRCPLCAHDHGSAADLLKAIEVGSSEIPPSLDALTAQKQIVEAEIFTFEDEVKTWSEAADTLETLTADLEDAHRILTEAKPTLETLDIDSKELRDDSLADQIAELRSKVDDQLTEANRLAEEHSRRFEVALGLQSVGREILSLSENVRALTDSVPAADLDELPPEEWTRVLGLIIKNTETVAAKARVEAANHRKSADDARAALAGLRTNCQGLTNSLTEVSEQIGIARAGRTRFETQWHLISGDEPWHYELLDQRQLVLDNARENLVKAKQEMDSARGALIVARRQSPASVNMRVASVS